MRRLSLRPGDFPPNAGVNSGSTVGAGPVSATFTPVAAKLCRFLAFVCVVSGAAVVRFVPLVELCPLLEDVWLPRYFQFVANSALTGVFFEIAFRCSAFMRCDFDDMAIYSSRLNLNLLTIFLFATVCCVYQCMAVNRHFVHRSWISEHYGGHQVVYSVRLIVWCAGTPLSLLVLGHSDPGPDGHFRNRLSASGWLTGIYRFNFGLGLVVQDLQVAWAMIALCCVCYFFASVEQVAFAFYVRSENRCGVAKCYITLVLVFLMGVANGVTMMGCLGSIDPVLEQKIYCLVDMTSKLAIVLVLWLLRQIDDMHILEDLRCAASTLAEDSQRLISSANVPIFRLDTGRHVVEWNNKMVELTGVSKEKVLGRSFFEFLADKSKAEGKTMVASALAGCDAPTAELTLTSPEGGEDAKASTMVLSGVPTRDKLGNVVGATCNGYDLTEVTAIREAEERKQRFMEIVSHELRSPLHGIIGLVDCLTCVEEDSSRVHQLSMVKNCASRLLDLVVNIMDLSSMGSKEWSNERKWKLSCDSVELYKIIEEVELLVRNATDKQGVPLLKEGVELRNNVPRNMPVIQADAYKCTQMFHNLLTNACKFTKQGQIEIAAQVDPSNEYVEVRISDTGKGISKEARERIWRPFEQEEQSETREYEGIGLGLSIVKEVVDRHCGQITLDSEVGVGTAFTVVLPISLPEAVDISMTESVASWASIRSLPPEPEPPTFSCEWTRTVSPRIVLSPDSLPPLALGTAMLEGGGDSNEPEVVSLQLQRGGPGRRPVILSVDDDVANQAVVEQALSDEYEIRFANNATEALEYFNTHSCLPDCMLLDVMLPERSGFEVCQDIREKLKISVSVLPVLMLSARMPPDSCVVQGLASGCNDYITKPFQKEVLRARVRTALQVKRLHTTELEYARHTELLYSIMPPHVIDRLQAGEELIAESHDSVTVLFSDIVGWTGIAESLTTSQMVVVLNELFSAFDEQTEAFGVFKVVTIGAAYMCAAGHDGSTDHADRIVRFAFAMIEATSHVRVPCAGVRLQLRIGVHTGPACTGVVGRKVPRYCFIGDTVNISSRMESNGTPGCIHVSWSTFDALDRGVLCGAQAEVVTGTIQVKDKGRIQTYLIVPKGSSVSRLRRASVADVDTQLRQELQDTEGMIQQAEEEARELESEYHSELETARCRIRQQIGELETVQSGLITLQLRHSELEQETRHVISELDRVQVAASSTEARSEMDSAPSSTAERPTPRVNESHGFREAETRRRPPLECPRPRAGPQAAWVGGCESERLPLPVLEKQLRHLSLEVRMKDKRIADLRRQVLALHITDAHKDDEMQHALLDLRG